MLCEELRKTGVPFCLIDLEGEYWGIKDRFKAIWVGARDLARPDRAYGAGRYRLWRSGTMPSKKKADGPWMASVPVVVSDRNVSKEWYTKRLGLELISNEEHWVTVGRRGRGSMLHLCQASDNGPGGIPLEPGPSGIVLVIPGDFEKECARLAKNGVAFSHQPEKTEWGWYATIRDPDGNEHNLSPSTGKEQYLEPAALDG